MSSHQSADCAGKRAFPSQAAATRTASIRRRRDHQAMQAYHCEHCYAWHLGHPAGHVDRRKKSPADFAED